jgi:hypothetical protein
MFNPVNKKVNVESIDEISAQLAADLKALDGNPVNLASLAVWDGLLSNPGNLQEINMQASPNIYSRHIKIDPVPILNNEQDKIGTRYVCSVSSSQPDVLEESIPSGGYPQSNAKG